MRIPLKGLIVALLISSNTLAAPQDYSKLLPAGVTNDQDEADTPFSPAVALTRITVPEGFQITQFAAEPDIFQPIAFTFDDRGRVWVVENFSHPKWKKTGRDRIVILEDTDHDGRMNKRTVFSDAGRYYSGIAYGFGGIFVCNAPELIFIPDSDGDDVPDGPAKVLLDGWATQSPHNVFNNLTWGPDGWLYGTVGQNGGSKVGKPGTKEEDRVAMSRGIWRYHPIRNEFEVVAEGAVNPWGLDFDAKGEGFFSNCVLPHLWHLVHGSYYQRRSGETDFPYAYERIKPIADHIHWGGGKWTSSRGGEGLHNYAGGGHAHTGAMIYLGDNWPKPWYGTFFLGNLHGNRINNDIISWNGKRYTASHGPDFLRADDKWFRTLSQKYGPDGGVYITDWQDYGECHDTDGSHRSSGRIYKITFGKPTPWTENLAEKSPKELVRLLSHKNQWVSRTARRLLQEGKPEATSMDLIGLHKKLMNSSLWMDPDTSAMNALFTLHACGKLNSDDLARLCGSKSAHVRSWAVRFICEDKSLSGTEVRQLIRLAETESSELVLMHLAGALPRLPKNIQWPLFEKLIKRDEPISEETALRVWYALAPHVADRPAETLPLISRGIPGRIAEFAAQRLVEADENHMQMILAKFVTNKNPAFRLAVMKGIGNAVSTSSGLTPPRSWNDAYNTAKFSRSPELKRAAMRAAASFSGNSVTADLQKLLLHKKEDPGFRHFALENLQRLQPEGFNDLLEELLDDTVMRAGVIKALTLQPELDLSDTLIQQYSSYDYDAKQASLHHLAARPSTSTKLLKSIKNGKIPKADLPITIVIALSESADDKVTALTGELFGAVRKTSEDKAKLAAQYKKEIESLGRDAVNLVRGRKIFEHRCSACHQLFGNGGDIGPDLTGSGRHDLGYLLENILDPSALVSKEYQLVTAQLRDGRVLSGRQVSYSSKGLQLRNYNQEYLIPRKQLKKLKRSQYSLMPEGLLHGLSIEEIRDLTTYLSSNPGPVE